VHYALQLGGYALLVLDLGSNIVERVGRFDADSAPIVRAQFGVVQRDCFVWGW
jgi:hypothetical protein